MESIEPEARYLGAEHFQSQGPARVILGRLGPPDGHTVAWIAVHRGKVAAAEIVRNGELAVFEEANGALELEALEESGYVFGSAVKHPHPLVLGTYSIHTSRHALEKGEARIREIGAGLQTENRR